MRAAPQPLDAMLEKQWDALVFGARHGVAPTLGWRSYHTLRSRGSAAGYPDRTLWRERLVFAELKRELTGKKSEDAKRRPSPAQVAILDGLARAGAEVYLWHPSDLDEVGVVLGRHWTFVPYRPESGASFGSTVPHLSLEGARMVPRSIWVPGVGRADEGGLA